MLLEQKVLLLDDVKKEVLEFCINPHGRVDILEFIQVEVTSDNYGKYVKQLLNQRFIAPYLSRNLSLNNQKYIITQKGRNYLKAIA